MVLACLMHWYISMMYVVPVVAVGGWGGAAGNGGAVTVNSNVASSIGGIVTTGAQAPAVMAQWERAESAPLLSR